MTIELLSDFVRSPNQAEHPDLYELENQAFDREGLVLAAMRGLAPGVGRTLLDLGSGSGSGYWLPVYAREAAEVIGVEPDQTLLPLAVARRDDVRALHGSAEHIPLPSSSVDVVHARFSYFSPPGCDAGLAEVLRVLRPGGALVVIDNDQRHGEFATLLAASPWAADLGQADCTDAWWEARGAQRIEVMSSWQFDRREDLEAVLGLEFPEGVVGPWLADNPDALGLSYGYVLLCGARNPDRHPATTRALPTPRSSHRR